MSTEQIIVILTEERDRINKAIEILGGVTATGKRRGRPPGKKAAEKAPLATDAAAAPAAKSVRRKRRKLSAEARARIAAAQKKRWAAARKV